jgi:hypothetical protein
MGEIAQERKRSGNRRPSERIRTIITLKEGNGIIDRLTLHRLENILLGDMDEIMIP